MLLKSRVIVTLILALVTRDGFANVSAIQNKGAIFEVVGACSWGPKALFGDDQCLHQPKSALAIFVRDEASGRIFVSNEMATKEVNYCHIVVLPDTSTLVPVIVERSRLAWIDPSANGESSLTYLPNLIGVTQTSTNSVNAKNAANGGEPLIYAPCFFIKAIN